MAKFMFVDVETTGHEPLRLVDGVLAQWHEIIEIGAVLIDDEPSSHEEFSVKIRPLHPERCIPNLINDYLARAGRGEWLQAVQLEEAMLMLCGFGALERVNWPINLVGQNFSFDWLFLSVAFAAAGISEADLARIFHYARLDTRSMAVQELWRRGTRYDPKDYSIRTDGLSLALGIPPEPLPHEALNGARQALAVFRALHRRK